MKIDIEWAELHSPLFLNGTNLQMKLDPTKRVGLKMAYDEDKGHLFVSYGGKTARLPQSSVLCMVEAEVRAPVEAKKTKPLQTLNAQVETPMSHVHAGPGAGQTGLGGKIR